tara:strand:- start:1051 stop:2616 length:1566 start_codon:yes stop_codon:yes gene_type:complete
MALNFGDLALLTAGDVAKMDTEARQKKIDDRLDELKENKAFYQRLAESRFATDEAAYQEELKSIRSLQSVYNEISEQGLDADAAADRIAIAKYGQSYLDAEYFQKNRMKNDIKKGFVEKEGGGFEFNHRGIMFDAPKIEDYYKGPEYWAKLADEIESGTRTKLGEQFSNLIGKDKKDVKPDDYLKNIEDMKRMEIKDDIAPEVYNSTGKFNSVADSENLITTLIPSEKLLTDKNAEFVVSEYKNAISSANTNTQMKNIADAISSRLGEGLEEGLFRFDEGVVVGVNQNGERVLEESKILFNETVEEVFTLIYSENGAELSPFAASILGDIEGNFQKMGMDAINKVFFAKLDNQLAVYGKGGIDVAWSANNATVAMIIPTDILKAAEENNISKDQLIKIASINEGYEYVNQEGETVKVDGLAIDKATAKDTVKVRSIVQNYMRDYIKNVGVQEMKIADAFTVVEDGTALTFKKEIQIGDDKFLPGFQYKIEDILKLIERGDIRREDIPAELLAVIDKYLQSE